MRKYIKQKLHNDGSEKCYICGESFGVKERWYNFCDLYSGFVDNEGDKICSDCEKVVQTAKEQVKYIRGLK